MTDASARSLGSRVALLAESVGRGAIPGPGPQMARPRPLSSSGRFCHLRDDSRRHSHSERNSDGRTDHCKNEIPHGSPPSACAGLRCTFIVCIAAKINLCDQAMSTPSAPQAAALSPAATMATIWRMISESWKSFGV